MMIPSPVAVLMSPVLPPFCALQAVTSSPAICSNGNNIRYCKEVTEGGNPLHFHCSRSNVHNVTTYGEGRGRRCASFLGKMRPIARIYAVTYGILLQM